MSRSRLTSVLSTGVAVVSLLAGGVANATTENPAADHEQVHSLVQEYLQERADRLTNRQQSAGFQVATTVDLAAQLRSDAARLDERRARVNAANGGYSRAEVAVTVEKVDVEHDGEVVAHVREHTKLHFRRTEVGGPSYEEFALPHVLTLVNGAGGLLLAEARALVTPGSLPPSTQFSPVDAKVDVTPSRPGAELRKPGKGEVGAGVKAAYNYGAMIDYANAHWSNYNSDYRSYDNDCTNFISQAMAAGGWGHVDGDRTNNASWYYGWFTFTTSYSWAGAENWYWFAIDHSARTSFLENVWHMLPSDVLQMDFDRDNNINHTMIVTASDANDLYLTYHTSNTHNKRLSTIIAENPNAWYYSHRT